MRETRAMAIPLIGDATRKVLVDAKFEVQPRIEWTLSSPHQPAVPIRILFADGRDVRIVWQSPARAIEVPALIDRDDFPERSIAHDLAHAVLVRVAQPLGAHLHDLLAGPHCITSQLGIGQRVGHGLLAEAIFACAHYLI